MFRVTCSCMKMWLIAEESMWGREVFDHFTGGKKLHIKIHWIQVASLSSLLFQAANETLFLQLLEETFESRFVGKNVLHRRFFHSWQDEVAGHLNLFPSPGSSGATSPLSSMRLVKKDVEMLEADRVDLEVVCFVLEAVKTYELLQLSRPLCRGLAHDM